jgi:hypothetical protein
MKRAGLVIALGGLCCIPLSAAGDGSRVPNPAIDVQAYLSIASDAVRHRETRRLSEDEFIRLSREPGPSYRCAKQGLRRKASSGAMNVKRVFPGHKVWARAEADIERITTIWRDCLATYGGPYLFGKRCMADAMYAPVVTRFATYDVKLDRRCSAYGELILAMPEMVEWTAAAKREPEEIDELDMEF